ncbi:MAG: agmatine deiminase [Clostridiales bacterium]|nr:agmatine deiminase [Clostridiales bacterium]
MSIRFPGEFELHDNTLMIWPVRPGSWGRDPSRAQKAYMNIFGAVLEDEDLYVLFGKDTPDDLIRSIKDSFRSSPYSLLPLKIDSDDSWARDTAPTFVIEDDMVKGIDWGFNAWGGDFDGLYRDYRKDIELARLFCTETGYGCIDRRDLILEGGSIACDGQGTLMVTESCLLSPGRNPSMSRDEIERYLCDALGVTRVLWLPRGIYNDETNEHVDNICAFVSPGEVVLAWTDDESDPQYALSRASYDYLSSQKDAMGREIKIHKLPIPDHPVCITKDDLDNLVFEEGEDTREAGERLAASYVNFYFTNGSILLPQFGGENTESDRRAVRIMTSLAGDRRVVPIYARDILTGGGNIHCITQQIPWKGLKT